MDGRMTALIIGGENNLVANRLEGWLGEHEVETIRIEELGTRYEVQDFKNTKYVFIFGAGALSRSCGTAPVNIDFGNDARIVYVNENQEIQRNEDWRKVTLHDVYGPGMEEDGWLPATLRLAVKNQNLILPPPSQKIGLLYVDDAVEAIMRACLMSGTAGKNFEIYGEEITSADLAAVLMDLAKMTKIHVAQTNVGVEEINEEARALSRSGGTALVGWRPEMGFREGMEPTLQYFFGKIDEEARKPRALSRSGGTALASQKVVIEREKKGWEVEVEPSYAKASDGELEIENEIEEKIVEELPKIDNKILEIRSRMLEDKEDKEEVIEEKEAEEKISNFQFPTSNEIKTEEKKPEVRKIKFKWPKIRWARALSRSCGTALVLGVVAWGMWWVWPMVKVVNLVKATEKVVASGKTETLAEEWGKLALLARSRLGVVDSGNYGELMRLTEEGAMVAKELVEMGGVAQKLADAILLDKEINWELESKNLIVGVEKLWNDSGKLTARMAGDWRWLPLGADARVNDLRSRLVSERERLAEARKLVAELPEILGVGGRREYMVLLQNQMELRPSGGFIGSYGILTFENGKLINFLVNDIYEADGQLKGHVEPPEPIKKYLGEAGYFMRDANWKADFGEVSKEIQWFLEKETGRKVDGVIGINLEVARAILGVIGEIRVTDFGEKINKDNLYEQAEYYSETKFFPGSKQKASFLGGIARQLFEEIKMAKGEKRWKMAEALLLMLNNREIQVAVNNKKTAEALAGAGWSGGMFTGECAKDRCLADYLFPVEANLGVNKANYFIKRQTEMLVEIGTNAVVRTVKISYENTAKSNAWPGGDYKNYLRVYLPLGISMAGVKIIDGGTGETIKTMGGEEMTVMSVAGKTEVGMLVMVPISSKRVVELKYMSPINLLSGDKFSYLNYLQKQSGWGDTGLVTLVSMPDSWQPVQVEPEATVVGGKLLFNRRWERDIKLGVEISK